MFLNENDEDTIINTGDYEYGVTVNSGTVTLNRTLTNTLAAKSWDADDIGVITLVAGSKLQLVGDGQLELTRL